MNVKKLICALMALMLMVSLCFATLADEVSLQTQLDEANARIAELEAELALYKPYYDAQIVAEYGDGGIIWLTDAQAAYDAEAARYANYGISVDAYASEIKSDVLHSLVEEAVLKQKAEELGLTELSEDNLAEIEETADNIFNQYVDTYKQYFTTDDLSEEEIVQQTSDYLVSAGLTHEMLVGELSNSFWQDTLRDYVVEGVTVSEEEIRAAYDAKVADDEQSYSGSDYSYNYARTNDVAIAWNPEGYRAVTHVLVKFDEDQSARYTELQSQLSGYQDELEALNAEPAEGAAEETAEETEAAEPRAAEETEAAEPRAAEETEAAEPRAAEEIEADIAATSLELDALYAELLPRAEEVIAAFEGGASFDDLIDQYGEDPGMNNAATRAKGYAVSADSTYWDPAFTEAAMSIESVGGISAPVYGNNGIHIIYYQGDITPGPVPYEDIAADIENDALTEKVNTVYNDQVAAWVEEAAPVYHTDRF